MTLTIAAIRAASEGFIQKSKLLPDGDKALVIRAFINSLEDQEREHQAKLFLEARGYTVSLG